MRYGHLFKFHKTAAFKVGIIEAKAEELLKQDVAVAESAVIRLINISLTNNQFDSLVSFYYNCGSAACQKHLCQEQVCQKHLLTKLRLYIKIL